ncbi:hypothetical protein Aperf_G00000101399 [Anoplocephala perfoliata]
MPIGTKLILEFMGDYKLPGSHTRVYDSADAELFHPKTIELEESQESITVGSSPSADYQIVTRSNFIVTGIHSTIKAIQDKYVIVDESIYGTYVDYRRIERTAELKSDQIVCFGCPGGNWIRPGTVVSPYKHDLKYKVKIIRGEEEEPSQVEEEVAGEALGAVAEPQPRNLLHSPPETDSPDIVSLRSDQTECSSSQSNSESTSLSTGAHHSGIAIRQNEQESQNAMTHLEESTETVSSSSSSKMDPSFSYSFTMNSPEGARFDEKNVIEKSETATEDETETVFSEDASGAGRSDSATLTSSELIRKGFLIPALSSPSNKIERNPDQTSGDSDSAEGALNRNRQQQSPGYRTWWWAKFNTETPRKQILEKPSLSNKNDSDNLGLGISSDLRATKSGRSSANNTPPADRSSESSSKSEKKPQTSADKENSSEGHSPSYSSSASQSGRTETRGIKRLREFSITAPPPIKVRKLDSLKIGADDLKSPKQEIDGSNKNISDQIFQGIKMNTGQQRTISDSGSSSGTNRSNTRVKSACSSKVSWPSAKNIASSNASKSKHPVNDKNRRRAIRRPQKKRKSTKDASNIESVVPPQRQKPPEGLYGYFDCCDHSHCKRPIEFDALIQCSTCQKWFHHLCVNLKKHESEDPNYDCPSCRNEKAMHSEDED